MDVRLPDGTIIQNVPDGTTRADLVTKLQRNGMAVPSEWLADSKPQPAPEVKPDAAAGGSTLKFGPVDTGIPISENVNNFLAGAGQMIHGTVMGASQYLPGGATREDVAERRRLDADLNKRKAATLGNIAATIPAAFLSGGTMGGAAAAGGILGLLQPSQSTAETITQGGMGAAGGAAGKWAGDRIAQLMAGRAAINPRASGSQTINVGPSNASAGTTVNANPQVNVRGGSTMGGVGPDPSAGLTEGQMQAMLAGRNLGMRVTPGQATGSRVLQQFEAKLESQPMSSGRFFDIKNNNQRVLNRSVAEAMGEKADELSNDVLDRAYMRMSKVFDSVADKNPRQIDQTQFLNRLSAVETDFEGMLEKPLMDNPLVRRYVDAVASGKATGEQLNHLQSQMGKAANSLRMKDPAQASALREVQHLVLDDIGRGLQPADEAAYRAARQQYRVYAMLADKPHLLNATTGNVSGANLSNTLQRTDRNGFARGQNTTPMYEAARFAQAFKPAIGDSGTATRSPLNILEATASVPIGIATRAYTSSPGVSAAQSLSTLMRDGVRPGSVSPRQADVLARLLAGAGASGSGATPLLLGNAPQQ